MKQGNVDDARERARLAESLPRAFAGLELLDEELEIGPGRTADWVGVDGAGRLILVLWLADEGDAEMLRVLDALAFLRRNARLLASHYGASRGARDEGHQVAVVSLAPTPRLLERLQGFEPGALTVLELRRLKARSGERAYLVPLEVGGGGAREPLPLQGLEGFLQALPVDARGVAGGLARRIQRMDDAIHCTVTDDGLTWRLGSDALCSLDVSETGLRGRVPGTGEAWPVATPQDADSFLDGVLSHYVALIEPPPGPAEGAAPGDPGGPELLLTPEELAAFHSFG